MTLNQKKPAGWYLTALAIVGGAATMVLYLAYAAALGTTDAWVAAGLLAGAACGAAQLFLPTGIFALIMSALYSVSTFAFITCRETIGSYTDYFSNIIAFGHPELIGQINAVVIAGALSAVLAVVSCFLPSSKQEV